MNIEEKFAQIKEQSQTIIGKPFALIVNGQIKLYGGYILHRIELYRPGQEIVIFYTARERLLSETINLAENNVQILRSAVHVKSNTNH